LFFGLDSLLERSRRKKKKTGREKTKDAKRSSPATTKTQKSKLHINTTQDPDNKRYIIADERLKRLFGEDRFLAFGIQRLVSKHVVKDDGAGAGGGGGTGGGSEEEEAEEEEEAGGGGEGAGGGGAEEEMAAAGAGGA
jgi:hypothetical protein